MKNKTFEKYLQDTNQEIEKSQKNIAKKFDLNSESGKLINDLVRLPLKIVGEIYRKIDYLAGNILKYPLAVTDYFLQKN